MRGRLHAGTPSEAELRPACLQRRPLTQSGHWLLARPNEFEDFELLLSDNAPTDETEDTCRDYARRDGRIRYFRQAENIDAAPNQDFVFRISRSELSSGPAPNDLFARDLLERCIAVAGRVS